MSFHKRYCRLSTAVQSCNLLSSPPVVQCLNPNPNPDQANGAVSLAQGAVTTAMASAGAATASLSDAQTEQSNAETAVANAESVKKEKEKLKMEADEELEHVARQVKELQVVVNTWQGKVQHAQGQHTVAQESVQLVEATTKAEAAGEAREEATAKVPR